jgi:hypothetical protein
VARKSVSQPVAAQAGGEGDDVARHLRRIGNLLALIAVKGETQAEKVVSLAAAGFSPAEIGPLLGTTANTVSVTLYQTKKKSKKR